MQSVHPQPPPAGEGLRAHREGSGFFANLHGKQDTKGQCGNPGSQESSPHGHKQTNSPTPTLPCTGAQLPHPTAPGGSHRDSPSSCCSWRPFVGVFFFLLSPGFTCFCTPVDLKQCHLHYLATPFSAFSITCEILQLWQSVTANCSNHAASCVTHFLPLPLFALAQPLCPLVVCLLNQCVCPCTFTKIIILTRQKESCVFGNAEPPVQLLGRREAHIRYT